MNGKGDTYRPTDKKRFDEGMDRVFGECCGRCLSSPCECAESVKKEIKSWKKMNSEETALEEIAKFGQESGGYDEEKRPLVSNPSAE